MCRRSQRCQAIHDNILSAAKRLQAASPAGFGIAQLGLESGHADTSLYYHLPALADQIRPSGHWGREGAVIWTLVDAPAPKAQELAAARKTVGRENRRGTEARRRVLQGVADLLKDHPEGVTIDQLALHVGLYYTGVHRHVRILAAAGAIVPAGWEKRQGPKGTQAALWKPRPA